MGSCYHRSAVVELALDARCAAISLLIHKCAPNGMRLPANIPANAPIIGNLCKMFWIIRLPTVD